MEEIYYYLDENVTEKWNEDMNELFVLKGTQDFGKVIATDSKGNKIFELKTGGIKVVAADQIEEVFPFTFAVSFDGNREYHFLGEADKFKVGDVLVYKRAEYNMGVCEVTKVDTKSRSATKTFSGYKLLAEKVN